ncbi:MAG: type and secretion system protein [Firmicutes bacterium]|nr:type and secretion system protein [Bacillota bacterium]
MDEKVGMKVPKYSKYAVIVILTIVLAITSGVGWASESLITLNIQNSEVRDILEAMAVVDGVNIIVDETVKGKMSLNIKDMPLDEALDLVVKTRGYTYQKMPNGTIVVAEPKTLLAGFGSVTVFPLKHAVAAELKKSLAGAVADDRLKVDDASNSLVFFGSPVEAETVRAAIESLDVPAQQVTIEAQILEISKSASKELGFDWTFAPGPVQSGSTSTTDLTNYGAISFGRAPDGNPYQFRYQAQLNALISKGNAKVLAKPKISTISGKEAKILIGDKVPVQSQTTTSGVTSTTVTYIDTGIKLVYTPVISPDGRLRAHLLAEVSTPSAALGGTNYKIATRTAETDLVMADGETLAIGGLISSTVSHTATKVPILGDLPLIGSIFKNVDDSSDETEIVVVITAKINK